MDPSVGKQHPPERGGGRSSSRFSHFSCFCFILFYFFFHLGVPGKQHYYLNVDRCAFGGETKQSALFKDIPNNKEVCGPIIFAVNQNCSAVYYYQDSPYEGWQQYQSVKKHKNLRESLTCKPKEEFK